MSVLTNAANATLVEINRSLESVRSRAKELGVAPETLQDAYGTHLMAPLLLAKSNCLLVLSQK